MTPALVTSELVFCSGNRQLVQRFRHPDTAHHFEFSAGSVAEDSGKIGTALRHGLSKNLFCRRLNKLEKMSIEKWEEDLAAKAVRPNRKSGNELSLRRRGMDFHLWKPSAKSKVFSGDTPQTHKNCPL